MDEVYPEEELKEFDNGLTFMKGPIRLGVFAKENAPDLPAYFSDRRVPFDGLPDRMRREFATLTGKGLVATAVCAERRSLHCATILTASLRS